MLTIEALAAINNAVRAVDARLEFCTGDHRKFVWDPPRIVGIVMLTQGGRRYASPLRDGRVAPFEVTTVEGAMRDAIDAAKELVAEVFTGAGATP